MKALKLSVKHVCLFYFSGLKHSQASCRDVRSGGFSSVELSDENLRVQATITSEPRAQVKVAVTCLDNELNCDAVRSLDNANN